MANILLIHTGGTIACTPTDNGLAPQPDLLEKHAKIIAADYTDIQLDMHAIKPIIDSSDMTPNHWNIMLEILLQHQQYYDGFVITHGTDTMAYSTAAIAYSLPKSFSKPIIFTGSMQPIGVVGSDADNNLRDAIIAATYQKNTGVYLQFAHQLLNGKAISKYRAKSENAFIMLETVNDIYHHDDLSDGYFYDANKRMVMLTMTPGFDSRIMANILTQCDGAVLRCFGCGNVGNDYHIFEALSNAKENNKPVIAISQALYGHMNIGKYAAGSLLNSELVIDGCNLHAEAAYIFLAQLLSGHDIRIIPHGTS